MNTAESLGYLKGLLEGLDMDKDKKESKVYKAIIDVLDNLANDIEDVYEEIDSIEEQVDAIDDDLTSVEEYLEDDDCCCDFEDDDCCCDEECVYEVACPECGEKITVDENTIEEGGMNCPACGEYLEFECDCGDDGEEE